MTEGETVNEIPNDQGFIDFFYSLPKCESKLIRIFNRNDFYTVHGDNAEYVSKSFLNTSQALKTIGPENKRLTSVVISQTRFESLLRHLLIDNNFCVEIYSKSNAKRKTLSGWLLEHKASPGCLGVLEDILYNQNVLIANQIVVAIHMDSQTDSISFVSIDILDCTFSFISFVDDSSFTFLESLLVRFNPKECLIPTGMTKERIKLILRKNNIYFSEYNSSLHESIENGEKVLYKLANNECHQMLKDSIEPNSKVFIPFQALINYLNVLEDEYCDSNYFFKPIEGGKFARLDLSSIANLHLFPTNSDNKSIHSLFQLLNHCKTVSGKKLLDKFIRQPLVDKDAIEARLNIVEYFCTHPQITTVIYENILAKIPDITKVYKKFTNGRCKLQDVYQIYLAVEQMPEILNVFEENIESLNESVQTEIVDKVKEVIGELGPFSSLVRKTIDLEKYYETRQFWINPNISEELLSINDEVNELKRNAESEFKKVCTELYQTFDIERSNVKMEMDKFGYYFRVTKQFGSCIFRSKNYEAIHSASVKDARFLTKNIKSLNHSYVDLFDKYETVQQKHISQLISECRSYLHKFNKLESVVAFIDVLLSFSKAAHYPINQYKRPVLLLKDSNKINLVQFRHPIIEVNKDMSFVANTIDLDRFKFYVITGPNMGGKSTLIRSVALCVLMAQIGSFVPCDEATISIVDGIYTRISANDNPAMGLSTFMAEMVETAAILRSATSNSLVVIDELGRSTGTFDGFGIAQSITEHLANKTKSYTLFATHFHSLGANLDAVGRLCMRATVEDANFVIHYVAEPGTANQSFGVQLAQSVHMPDDIVQSAKRKLSEMENSFTCKDKVQKLLTHLKSKVDRESVTEENVLDCLKEIDFDAL